MENIVDKIVEGILGDILRDTEEGIVKRIVCGRGLCRR